MDWFSYLIAGVMVYLAVAIFLFGMAYQVVQWLRSPGARVKTGVFPKPNHALSRWLRVGIDSFTFPDALKMDRWIWGFTLLFHFGLLGAFVGHLRLVREFTFLVALIGPGGMDQLGLWGGGVMGILLMVGLFYFLFRRLGHPYREISIPEDYILLFLLMVVVLLGNIMRFFGDVHTPDYRNYLQSLIVFRPAFPPALGDSPTKWTLVLHVLFANLLLIYLPFSKLIHMIATFPANLARRV
jgi:nitrate reductase gamma subunit